MDTIVSRERYDDLVARVGADSQKQMVWYGMVWPDIYVQNTVMSYFGSIIVRLRQPRADSLTLVQEIEKEERRLKAERVRIRREERERLERESELAQSIAQDTITPHTPHTHALTL